MTAETIEVKFRDGTLQSEARSETVRWTRAVTSR